MHLVTGEIKKKGNKFNLPQLRYRRATMNALLIRLRIFAKDVLEQLKK